MKTCTEISIEHTSFLSLPAAQLLSIVDTHGNMNFLLLFLMSCQNVLRESSLASACKLWNVMAKDCYRLCCLILASGAVLKNHPPKNVN